MHRVLATIAGFGVFVLAACAPEPTGPERAEFVRTTFADLDGWQADRQASALAALRRSCALLTRLPDAHVVGDDGLAGTAAEWRPICAAAERVPTDSDAAAREFFVTWFVPYWVNGRQGQKGLFTGYFEPLLRGARRADRQFKVPLYGPPDDLVKLDLGQFRTDLRGQRTAGRVVNGSLRPYPDRGAIDAGALTGQSAEIVWVDDPIDAFLLHVQGSGRVLLKDGSVLRLGYAASNGHRYVSIGRELVERGALSPEEADWPAIRAWMDRHPDEIPALLASNPSYVFFRVIEGDGPIGAQGAVLTAGRSLAVDPRFVPLGVPVWLDAMVPVAEKERPDIRLQRLMVAQDTGGAIKGVVRGDVFWGHGAEAESIAGRMKHRGRYAILLPKAVAGGDVGA